MENVSEKTFVLGPMRWPKKAFWRFARRKLRLACAPLERTSVMPNCGRQRRLFLYSKSSSIPCAFVWSILWLIIGSPIRENLVSVIYVYVIQCVDVNLLRSCLAVFRGGISFLHNASSFSEALLRLLSDDSFW